jgi:arginyl-tRNA synthetase
MLSLTQRLSERVHVALSSLLSADDMPATLIVPTQNPDFGDFQCNVAMGLARALRKAPRAIAQDIVDALDVADLCETPEIAGPGFINLRLKAETITAMLIEMAAGGERLGIPPAEQEQRIVVDFSSPNLAKEMHVGHLRSTIIGDSIARFLEFAGHSVLRTNHVGDWGTQFGMLLHYLRTSQPEAIADPASFAIDDLEDFYRAAKKAFDESEEFAESARQAVVDLQAGDPATLAIWKVFCTESLRHCHQIYDALDIRIEDRGESTYNDDLAPVVEELLASGLATESEGAICVFLDEYEVPMIIRKRDGGYIYATTDLAGIRYRVRQQQADRIIYVTDARQGQHFDMVFQTAVKAGWAKPGTLQHVGFGMMLGKDGKPFKTRSGGTIKLSDLIAEAEKRALVVARELGKDLGEDELPHVARVAGRGAVKYADLMHGIGTDYKFDWDKMLAKDGNTAVYLLYNGARTNSLGQRLGVDIEALLAAPAFVLEQPQELALAKRLLLTHDVWQIVLRDLTPHALIAHLYELAKDYSSFWNSCNVKDAEPALRDSRLALTGLVARSLKWGLSLIGIETLERM